MEAIAVWIAALSLVAAISALFVAVVTMRRSDRNASASTLVTLFEALRSAWARYLEAPDAKAAEFQFAELINLLELACAVLVDKAVHGAAREILDEYVAEVLALLADDEPACARIKTLKAAPNTFKYVKLYLLQSDRGRALTPLLASVLNVGAQAHYEGELRKAD